MKLRWWIMGAVAVVAGGILIVKHFLQEKTILHSINNEDENNFEELTPGILESEFEGTDFLI